jgi:hypothetical protein
MIEPGYENILLKLDFADPGCLPSARVFFLAEARLDS